MTPLDLTRFDLNLLVVLEALWAERHVGRAAEKLHLSQSATSHALSRLRAAFDDQLFIRNPRGIEPTPLAVELMPQVAAVLESVRLVVSPRGAFDPGRFQGTLSVAATDHAVLTVISPVLAKIQAAAPSAVLKLKPADAESALRMLDSGELDIVLGAGSFFQVPQRFECQIVHKERFIGIARNGHPALVRRGNKLHMDLDDFVRLPHILVSPRGDARGAVDDALESMGRTRKVSATCPSFLAVPFMVGASESIAVVAERVALRLQETAQLSLFELPLALPTWEVLVMRARGRANEPVVQWLTGMMIAG
ncbi:LysR family transcriptional regulator [Burkholderia aenigmatica]|uniref:LysR family transcriptional regulator n=1 Tax=Burkholderia aenigmatica TaxID=2015348 RepID=A0ABY6Y404_9BURK|nr:MULTISPECIES: LysR family transcriptional regulator [Burkholderia]AYQ43359.1 LysR family transcriptional regulator [Burkholderia lata]VWD06045.1 LysR family transcriptional regulator [Burkholderia aenigmatica]VWD27860.1 LysR family transcriptional regulator [Burkholderia aenigmatica]VWD54351.1 LysR family transcriptional regulator [Burkholderia aenigmatica]